jgi:syntaxin 1B/2/3
VIAVTIVIIIVVAVVAYIMVNRAANGGGGGGGGGGDGNNNNQNAQKRSLFQRNVMDDLHMNTARAAEIAPGVAPTRPHPRSLGARVPSSVRGVGVVPKNGAETLAKRFVVDWQGADTTGSED